LGLLFRLVGRAVKSGHPRLCVSAELSCFCFLVQLFGQAVCDSRPLQFLTGDLLIVRGVCSIWFVSEPLVKARAVPSLSQPLSLVMALATDPLGDVTIAAVKACIMEQHTSSITRHLTLNNTIRSRPKDRGGPVVPSVCRAKTFTPLGPGSASSGWQCILRLPHSFASGVGRELVSVGCGTTRDEASEDACCTAEQDEERWHRCRCIAGTFMCLNTCPAGMRRCGQCAGTCRCACRGCVQPEWAADGEAVVLQAQPLGTVSHGGDGPCCRGSDRGFGPDYRSVSWARNLFCG